MGRGGVVTPGGAGTGGGPGLTLRRSWWPSWSVEGVREGDSDGQMHEEQTVHLSNQTTPQCNGEG